MSKRQKVIDLLTAAGVLNIKDSGENVMCSCPFAPHTELHKHDVDRSAGMGLLISDVSPTLINCFACGWKAGPKQRGIYTMLSDLAGFDSRYEQFLAEARSLDEPQAEDVLDALAELALTTTEARKTVKVFDEADWVVYSGLYHPYLERRGISKKVAKRWDAGYDSFRRRVVFPVRALNGDLCGAVGRAIDKKIRAKYYNYWEFEKEYTLFGLQLCEPGRPTIVVEGPFDAIGVSRYVKDSNVVAALGSSLSKWQVDTLVDMSPHVLILADEDEAGDKFRKAAVAALCQRVSTFVARYKTWEADDPFSLGPAVVDVLEYARPAHWKKSEHARK